MLQGALVEVAELGPSRNLALHSARGVFGAEVEKIPSGWTISDADEDPALCGDDAVDACDAGRVGMSDSQQSSSATFLHLTSSSQVGILRLARLRVWYEQGAARSTEDSEWLTSTEALLKSL